MRDGWSKGDGMEPKARAGWYPDPHNPVLLRYWDGARWTDHRHEVSGPGRVAPTAARSSRAGATVWGWAIGALAVVGLIAAITSVGAGVEPTAGRVSTSPLGPTAARSTAPAAALPQVTATPAPKPSKAAPPLVAVVGVVDGDTIKVRIDGRTERVRVIGIDTPELRGSECYAQQAASRMQSLVQSKKVRLSRDPTQRNRDRYERLLRHVALPDGRQVAEILIAGGYGEEYTYDEPYAGRAAYRAAEKAARADGKGIWSSGCRPEVADDPQPLAPTACLIKGNIASDGERIYHVPGQRYYDVTKISESKGERWFCTEEQARDAGWRRSKL